MEASPTDNQPNKKQKEKKVETRKPEPDADAPVKTKAELKAERRAKQVCFFSMFYFVSMIYIIGGQSDGDMVMGCHHFF